MTQNNASSEVMQSEAHSQLTVNRHGGRTMESIEAALQAKLSPEAVKERKKAGIALQYIEGWHAIAEMNRIFGNLGWSRKTEYCKEVCRYENEKKNKVVGYESKVIITIGDIVREGTGHGSGVARDLFDAIEGAAKEAETDAMKRALMTLGYPLGLALYDKTRANVQETDVQEKKEKATTVKKPIGERIANAKAAMGSATTKEALDKITGSQNYTSLLNDTDGTPSKTEIMNFTTECYDKFLTPTIEA